MHTPTTHQKLETHYTTLQVVESASLEVIKGAYKHLSQRWHPDKNPDNPQEAQRITQLINEAYAVLSDPDRKQQYDRWVKAQREFIATTLKQAPCPEPECPSHISASDKIKAYRKKHPLLKYVVWAVIAASVALFALHYAQKKVIFHCPVGDGKTVFQNTPCESSQP